MYACSYVVVTWANTIIFYTDKNAPKNAQMNVSLDIRVERN